MCCRCMYIYIYIMFWGQGLRSNVEAGTGYPKSPLAATSRAAAGGKKLGPGLSNAPAETLRCE